MRDLNRDREPAKILAFPSRPRPSAANSTASRDAAAPLALRRPTRVASYDAWYHEAAIAEEMGAEAREPSQH